MIELTTGIVFLMTSMYGSGYSMNAMNESNSQELFNDKTNSALHAMIASSEIESYMKDKYSDTPILVEIARCESTLRQYGRDGKVIRGRANRNDVGVMQINEKYHGESAKDLGYDIYTTEGNIAFGKYLYDKYGVSPWSASSPCWSKSGVELAKK